MVKCDVRKATHFIFGELPNQSLCLRNTEEAKNTDPFSKLQKEMRSRSWVEWVDYHWVNYWFSGSFFPLSYVIFPSIARKRSRQIASKHHRLQLVFPNAAPARAAVSVPLTTGTGSTETPPMASGLIGTNISGHNNSHLSNEKTLQKAPSLLVNKSLEGHNITFKIVLDRKQQFVFM